MKCIHENDCDFKMTVLIHYLDKQLSVVEAISFEKTKNSFRS